MAFSYVRIADFADRWSCTSSDTLPNTRSLAVSSLFCASIYSSVSRLAIRTLRWSKRSFHLQRAYVVHPNRSNQSLQLTQHFVASTQNHTHLNFQSAG